MTKTLCSGSHHFGFHPMELCPRTTIAIGDDGEPTIDFTQNDPSLNSHHTVQISGWGGNSDMQ